MGKEIILAKGEIPCRDTMIKLRDAMIKIKGKTITLKAVTEDEK